MTKESASFPFRKARCDKIRVILNGLVRENVQNFIHLQFLAWAIALSTNNDKTSLLQFVVCSDWFCKMATLLPPPGKKQKREIADRAREQQEIEVIPRTLGSVVLQFIDESTGTPTKGEIKVPVANTSVRELETILNTILNNVGGLLCISRVLSER